MEENRPKVTHLVIDTVGFIHNYPINDYGENIYTLPEVIEEIKDENTRQTLQCVPYQIKYRIPSADDIKFVSEFARKTGDYSQLSMTDLKLMALTYKLEKELNGINHLRTEPFNTKIISHNNVLQSNQSTYYGFNNEQTKHLIKDKSNDDVEDDENKDKTNQITNDDTDCSVREDESDDESDDDDDESDEEDDGGDEEDDGGDECSDDDTKGWITPNNVNVVKENFYRLKIDDEKPENISVGCLTGDYAIQNVLMQIGLKVISPKDGLYIKETKQFILRCYACFKFSSKMNNKFCFHCGNANTLKRVAVTTKDDGSKIVYINFKKPINIRGTRYSLPMPKGGKHSNNPILVMDQPIPQHRKSKLTIDEKKRLNPESILNDPDYVTRQNPFAINDVYSKASLYTTGKHRSKNPNETQKSTGNRKKKSNKY